MVNPTVPDTHTPLVPDTRQIVSILGALCLFLAGIEYLIPKPLPFMRIGLANLPVMAALGLLPPRYLAMLVLIKTLGQGLLSGTLFSYVFLFSCAGSASSAVVMYLLWRGVGGKRRNRIGFPGLGVAGALVSNGVQLVLARYWILGAGVQYLAPPFLGVGTIAGWCLGVCCAVVTRRSRFYAYLAGAVLDTPLVSDTQPPPDTRPAPDTPLVPDTEARRTLPLPAAPLLFGAGLLMGAAFLANPSTLWRAVQWALFWGWARLAGKRNSLVMTVFMTAGIVGFNLLAPYGQVVWAWGPVRITQGALLTGLHKAITLEALLMLSRVVIRRDLQLPALRVPGGAALSEAFRLFEALRTQFAPSRRRTGGRGTAVPSSLRIRIARSAAALIPSIDQALFAALSPAPAAGSAPSVSPRTAPSTRPSAFILTATVILLTGACTILGLGQ